MLKGVSPDQVKGSDYQELVQAPNKKKLNPKDILKPPPKVTCIFMETFLFCVCFLI